MLCLRCAMFTVEGSEFGHVRGSVVFADVITTFADVTTTTQAEVTKLREGAWATLQAKLAKVRGLGFRV